MAPSTQKRTHCEWKLFDIPLTPLVKFYLCMAVVIHMAMQFQEYAILAISFIGFISVCKHLIKFLRWVWIMFLRPPNNLKEEYGSWAIITGPTDGIGKAIAFELASKGLNLVLVGRNPSKLDATSKEISDKFGGQVVIKEIVIDLGKSSGKEIVNAIERGIQGLDVGILVNNAGIGYPYPRYFHEVDLELMENIIKVNLEAATWVLKAVIPIMLKKNKGAVVNIGSGSTKFIPSYPLNAIYAASKAYLAVLSRCLFVEYKQNKGIHIQCQFPGFVATKMIKLRAISFMISSTEMYGKASSRFIGHEHTCVPCWNHSVQDFFGHLVPDDLLSWFLLRFFLEWRRREQLKDSQNKLMLQQQENAVTH